MLAIAAAIIALAFSALLFERSGSLGVARAMLDETGRASARLMAKNLSDDDKERAARAAAISLFKGSASLSCALGSACHRFWLPISPSTFWTIRKGRPWSKP